MLGDEVHRFEEERKRLLADEVVEVDPHPTRSDQLTAACNLTLVLPARLDVDSEQSVSVWTGARAASAALYAEEVVEQRNNEVVMKAHLPVTDDERHDRQPIRVGVPQDLDVRVSRPCLDRPVDERPFLFPDRLRAHSLFERKDHSAPDGTDDVGRAALLAVLGVAHVMVLGRVDEADGSTTGHRRHPVGKQFLACDEQSRSSRTADHLVGAHKDGVLVRMGVIGVDAAHRDSDVGSSRSHIPERERTVTVQQR